MAFQGFSHSPADKGGSQGVPLDILPADQFLDNFVSGRFRPEPEFFHHLNQFALGKPRWWLCLFFIKMDCRDRKFFARFHYRQNGVFGIGVGVYRSPACFFEPAAGSGIPFTGGCHADPHRHPFCIGRECCQESSDDQFIHLPVFAQFFRSCCPGRVNRRVIGRRFLTLGRGFSPVLSDPCDLF